MSDAAEPLPGEEGDADGDTEGEECQRDGDWQHCAVRPPAHAVVPKVREVRREPGLAERLDLRRLRLHLLYVTSVICRVVEYPIYLQ